MSENWVHFCLMSLLPLARGGGHFKDILGCSGFIQAHESLEKTCLFSLYKRPKLKPCLAKMLRDCLITLFYLPNTIFATIIVMKVAKRNKKPIVKQ